jgi:hypothetical protein
MVDKHFLLVLYNTGKGSYLNDADDMKPSRPALPPPATYYLLHFSSFSSSTPIRGLMLKKDRDSKPIKFSKDNYVHLPVVCEHLVLMK